MQSLRVVLWNSCLEKKSEHISENVLVEYRFDKLICPCYRGSATRWAFYLSLFNFFQNIHRVERMRGALLCCLSETFETFTQKNSYSENSQKKKCVGKVPLSKAASSITQPAILNKVFAILVISFLLIIVNGFTFPFIIEA